MESDINCLCSTIPFQRLHGDSVSEESEHSAEVETDEEQPTRRTRRSAAIVGNTIGKIVFL